MRDLTRRQARWALYLSRFHFVIKYKKGSQMQADALSRSAVGGKFLDAVHNRQVTVLKPEQFIAAAAIHFKPDDDSLTEHIRRLSAREAEVLEGLRALGKAAPHALTEGVASWEEEDGLVYFKGKLYVPNERALRREVLQTCHDNLTAGHPGKNGTLELVGRHYWWPRMAAFVAACYGSRLVLYLASLCLPLRYLAC